MGIIDNNGLSRFYSKLKERFIQSVNSEKPDANGNVAITHVATADNLVSPDGFTLYDTFIFRAPGGTLSLDSGPAQLLYIKGNTVFDGHIDESIDLEVTNDLTATINANTWRNNDQVTSSGTYKFYYYKSTQRWQHNSENVNLASYGITVNTIASSSATANVDGSISSAQVNLTTFETQITTTGKYTFVYDTDHWKYNTSTITLSNYGITYVGTPADEDTITVDYIAATPNSILTVIYVKGVRGTIHNTKPTSFEASGFNQFNKNDNSSYISASINETNGVITQPSDNYVCFCKAVGGVKNGYTIYSSSGAIVRVGYCASLPQLASTVTLSENPTPSLAHVVFDNTGYVVAEVTSLDDICIHPCWSGRDDSFSENYQSPSTINIPATDVNGTNLPLASWGMPAIGDIADTLDLSTGNYIKYIQRDSYSSEKIEELEENGTKYIYDDTYIYYVLDTPVVYNVIVDPNYTVNDFGTEEFIFDEQDTNPVPVTAQTLYGQNLRDKLRLDVELKKIEKYDTVIDGGFISDSTYTDYGYVRNISISGVTQDMIPQVVLDVPEATSGNFAPVSITYNGGVSIFAKAIPSASFTIPTIICWRKND